MEIMTENHSFQKKKKKKGGSKSIAVHSVLVSTALPLVMPNTRTVIQSAGRVKHHWRSPFQLQFSAKEEETVDKQIAKVVLKAVLIISSDKQGDFLSTMFT